ncbi:MAG TPA: hypothetical protein VI893_00010 [Thermoplasmata archaeon]|nr:hypothetical protein [Thermoplasmata archaeon]
MNDEKTAEIDEKRITLEKGEDATISGVRFLNSTGDGIQVTTKPDGTVVVVRCCLHEM